MATSHSRKRRAAPRGYTTVAKPQGVLHPRVQKVGPEHFGILCFDCAKTRSRYFLADFYGKVLLEPTTLAHTQGDLHAAIDRVRLARVVGSRRTLP